jgi:hypothetical protein
MTTKHARFWLAVERWELNVFCGALSILVAYIGWKAAPIIMEVLR